MSDIKREQLTVTASDGRALSASFWPGAAAKQRTVVMLPGLAVPQSYLSQLAGFLADAGWGVMTFDYRGVGRSRSEDEAADRDVTMDDWAGLDIPAVIDAARERTGAEFLGVLAHSLGGQLLGQSPAASRVDGAVFVSAQRGIPRLFRGRGWLAVRYAYTAFPLVIRLLGRMPVSKLTFPVACPAPAVLQWVRWGRTGVFSNAAGENIEARFADFTGRLIAVSVDDDSYAPAAAVDALTAVYTAAPVQREHIRPDQYGMKAIGHFGLFHRRASRELWNRIDTWLRDTAAGAATAPGSA